MTVTIQIKISAKAIDLVEDMEIIIFPQRKIPNRTNKLNEFDDLFRLEKGRKITLKLNIWISPINHNKSSQIFL